MIRRFIASLVFIVAGIVLLSCAASVDIPGGALTTYESLDGDSTTYYVFDDKYSAIDEYVGGDAYNYIIGASLVSGKISGAMTSQAIYNVGGVLCICLGAGALLLGSTQAAAARKEEPKEEPKEKAPAAVSSDSPENDVVL